MSLRYNLGQLALLVFDCLPAPLVIGTGYRNFRRRLSRNPERYEVKSATKPFTKGGWRERGLTGPETDLVIDGFPGSANSFASNVVRRAIDRPTRVESHFHYTAQLRRARHFKVPTVVPVRPPRDAADSLKSKVPATWDWLIILRWLLYHRYVERYQHEMVIVPFAALVADIDILRRRVPAIQALVTRPLEADQNLRRAARSRVHVDASGWPASWLLTRAQALHDRLIGPE